MQNQPAAGSAQRIEVTLQPPPAAAGTDWLAAATMLAWPLAALVVVIVLRDSIAAALKGSARAQNRSTSA